MEDPLRAIVGCLVRDRLLWCMACVAIDASLYLSGRIGSSLLCPHCLLWFARWHGEPPAIAMMVLLQRTDEISYFTFPQPDTARDQEQNQQHITIPLPQGNTPPTPQPQQMQKSTADTFHAIVE
jgi:hypothetical protein